MIMRTELPKAIELKIRELCPTPKNTGIINASVERRREACRSLAEYFMPLINNLDVINMLAKDGAILNCNSDLGREVQGQLTELGLGDNNGLD